MIARIGAMKPWEDDDGSAMIEFVCSHYGGPTPDARPTYIYTLRIGWMLVQLFRPGSLDEDQVLAPFEPHPTFHPLWPVGTTMTWPPPKQLPAEYMEAIAHPPTLPIEVVGRTTTTERTSN
ncbi:hypothetical protein [Actinacidiphila oryziradicis]|uniref:Uncharacterized protein n=1 Tax=Actinacidiphila oryziradicis TaxID=2571141 RepID=A0A4V5MW49_9ACTN|nr:hypothetical protein [Actinacidiphila oryziradicis]TJZ94438.1 hypothetical protein FCI23_53760 [Actinacidiphila oryziradicis]